jgi:lysophospholipase L1-like esterase
VLADERLRSDSIHANAAGYEQFARGLVATLRAAGLLVA